ERGAYLNAMLAQWQSGELQAIPDDPARLAQICGLPEFPLVVREKFTEIRINGRQFLQQKRLKDIWAKQKNVYDAQARAGQHRAKHNGNHNADQNAEQGAEQDKKLDTRKEILDSKDIPTTSGDFIADTIWNLGLNLLLRAGNSESSARSFLGK